MSKITRDELVAKDACEEGLAAFDAAYPDGVAEYDPTSVEDAARILGGPLAAWWAWAAGKGATTPFRLVAGYRGTATAGDWGTATAGYRGTATAGYRGTATAGDYGTATTGREGVATVGRYGSATVGDRGTATVGDYGTATVGLGGTATAGVGGIIAISRWSGRPRLIVGYIGETLDAAGEVLEADTAYRLDLAGRFVRAETTT